MSFNPEKSRQRRAKAAQGREKTELPDLFTQTEAEFDFMKVSASVSLREGRFDRQAEDAKSEHEDHENDAAGHNSFP